MSEEKTKKASQSKDTASNPDAGSNSPASTLLQEVKAERERAEKARDELRAENDRLEQLRALDQLGGKADGASQEEVPKDESPSDYMKRITRNQLKDGEGTGY